MTVKKPTALPSLSFVRVLLERGDEISSLFLLENGGIKVNSYWSASDGFKLPLLFLDISHNCTTIVRDLSRRGANLDEMHAWENEERLTSVGFAINNGKNDALVLLHRLGASMLSVFHCHSSCHFSAVECAIASGAAGCLIFLLDEIDSERPVQLSLNGITAIVDTPAICDPERAIAVLKVLKSWGFDFEVLKTEGGISDNGEVLSFATSMIFFAKSKGHAGLLRFIVKDLGIISNKEALEIGTSIMKENEQ